jgi:hypothetical protein
VSAVGVGSNGSIISEEDRGEEITVGIINNSFLQVIDEDEEEEWAEDTPLWHTVPDGKPGRVFRGIDTAHCTVGEE